MRNLIIKMKILSFIILVLMSQTTLAANCEHQTFSKFLDSFFQKITVKKISFPTTVTHTIEGGFVPDTETVLYTHDRFNELASLIRKKYSEALNQKAVKTVEKHSTEVRAVKFTVPDSGFLIYFNFKKIDDCWRLVRFDDVST